MLALGTWRGVHDQVMDTAKFDITRTMVNQSFAQQYAKLPRLHFALSENARHFILFDDPSWFFAKVDAFFPRFRCSSEGAWLRQQVARTRV